MVGGGEFMGNSFLGGILLLLATETRGSSVCWTTFRCIMLSFHSYFYHWYKGSENCIKITWTRAVVLKLERASESPGILLKIDLGAPHWRVWLNRSEPYFEKLWAGLTKVGPYACPTHIHTLVRYSLNFLPNTTVPFLVPIISPKSLVLISFLTSSPFVWPKLLTGTSRKGLWICLSGTDPH